MDGFDWSAAAHTMSPSIAFVFPGQGSQSAGMLAELAAQEPLVRQTFAEASQGAGVDLWEMSREGAGEQLNQTEFTQPALLAASVPGTAWASTARWSPPTRCRWIRLPGWCAFVAS